MQKQLTRQINVHHIEMEGTKMEKRIQQHKKV